MSVHVTTEKVINTNIMGRLFWFNNLEKNIFKEYYFYLESNVGKQIGVQVSAVLNDSVELIRFNIK